MEYIWKLLSIIIFAILCIFTFTNLKIKRVKANQHLKYLRKQIKKYNIQSTAEAFQIVQNASNTLKTM